ncbi:MAG: hypoxanthine phosphoribosyltransferase [Oscillospiraceae bacterium]|nr:hypoxanthine phosphoribosyltransferase [Oscillospiraceae bacterium]
MALHKDFESLLFSEEQIKTRIAEMAAQIDIDYKGKTPLLIGVLKGSFIFMSDLMRAMKIECTVDFLAVSSYGTKSETSGQVRLLKDINENIEGRDVIVVEDILDSGITLSYIMKLLSMRRPASIKLCTLLDKPERRRVQVDIHYRGFEVPDAFVVGYGFDFAEKYRNVPYIGILKPSLYAR